MFSLAVPAWATAAAAEQARIIISQEHYMASQREFLGQGMTSMYQLYTLYM